jgi:hypothetical protein
VTCDPDEGDDDRVLRDLIRHPMTRVTEVARRVSRGAPERGEATGWASLAGLAAVGTTAMVARYHDLLVQALVTAVDTPLDGLPGL